MTELSIRTVGRAGRITLTRPKALNSLSYQMCLDIEAALDAWRDDEAVSLIVIDAEGDKAFCAGGDIQAMYERGLEGDYEFGRTFWRDEYRMNAKIAEYPKPIVAFMQGFVMGGGVGVGGHARIRVVGETSQVAMPETGIGLVPDVGGTYLLARAPGKLGEYLGATSLRMGPGDAIHAGFADHYIEREYWLDLISQLEESGDAGLVATAAQPAPESPLAQVQAEIDTLFDGTATEIAAKCDAGESETAKAAAKALRRASPLSVHCTLANIARARNAESVRQVLVYEFEYTYRAMEHGDFLEGIRAQIIDRDRNPNWRHASIEEVPEADIARMRAPLGDAALTL
ncbi:enoyl-CoA hydratase/isomerase family protein [Maritimibacter sp. UBA3975]|uniref:enoyl-CoA hydratase/isomerase family protein n=1 Tax=Maritimibacter sp. UBA3975 TaxID=1946833 RepID=UPI000C092794|nr:enoyl-CoA hydratase/isomerase family protein [Maritimibacter sp. UBA3975]MAM61183.1 enoyl-CoA hydratase [Maritimibacter sp.]|tara:strand:+ start:14871 stop:15899 length:1029 start_codon:yes stop_codon:yes gene_type:complete